MRFKIRTTVFRVSHILVALCILSGHARVQARLLDTGLSRNPNFNHSVVPQPIGESVCDHNEACMAAESCSFDFEAKVNLKPCSTASAVNGICCPTSGSNETTTSSIRAHENPLERPSDYLYLSALHDGQQEYQENLRHEDKHRAAMAGKDSESLFHRMLQPAGLGDHVQPQSPDEQADVYGSVFASQRYAELANMTLEERRSDQFVRVPRSVRKRCLPPVPCHPHLRYRTINGSCNNPLPDRTSWGKAGYPFDRVLPPVYEDGVWAPRIHSVTGNLLQSPRTISVALFPDLFRPDPRLNILFMQLGQFTAHDFTLTRSITLRNGQPIECCSHDGFQEFFGPQLHFACMPIPVRPDDPFYSKFGVRCLNFVRARLAHGPKCHLGYAKQADLVTHFIDASVVYGSTEDVAFALRLFQQGKLRVSFPTGIELLPFARDRRRCVPWARVCYEAGDIRVNQLLALTMVHTLFVREHNRLAEQLSRLNPHWDDEIIYQETRRIVIAEFQNVVFNEYLPILLGHSKVQQFGLLDPVEGFTNFYNPNIRPMTLAEVAVAAQRYGHSTVEGFFRLLHKQSPPEVVFIKDIFNDPSKTLEPDSFDEMMFSFNKQPMEQMDNAITSGLTRFLFKERKPFGSDLAAINIQRGRDFALHPYNDYREMAGLPRITDFRQLGEVGARLAQVYESPEDIDLWPGGLLEPPVDGAVVGPTFSHLLAEGYARYKFGDRYYFTNSPEVNPGAFTLQQLSELRRTSLASIICANVDNRFDFYQAPEAFLQPGPNNVPVPCAEYYLLQLEAWRSQG